MVDYRGNGATINVGAAQAGLLALDRPHYPYDAAFCCSERAVVNTLSASRESLSHHRPSEMCVNCAYNVLISSIPWEQAMSAIAFADVLESARETGTSRISAVNLANILGLRQQDLATLAGVHRNTVRTHPESPKLQATLRDLMRVLSAAVEAQPDVERALFLVKNYPVPAFRHKTLLQLVQEGRTDDAVDYLESISSGFVG